MTEQKNITEKNRQVKPIEDSTFYKFEEIGDKLTGILMDKGFSDKWKVGLYEIKNEEGEYIRFLGKTQLDRLMNKTELAKYIEIELIDKMKTEKGTMLIFEVRQ